MDKQLYLKNLDIVFYKYKTKDSQNNSNTTQQNIIQNKFNLLVQEINLCTKCELYKYREQAISGYTQADITTHINLENLNPTWLIVGESPKEEEDKQNLPFAGEIWNLLQKMLASINIDLSKTYITNVLKCKNIYTKANLEHIAHCEPYLFKQIEVLKPKIILAFGKVAAQTLSQKILPLNSLRGNVYDIMDSKLIVTYHPSYLLNNPHEKRKAWHDLLLAKKTYEGLAF